MPPLFMSKIVWISTLTIIGVVSCKIARVGKDMPAESSGGGDAVTSSKAPLIQPQRQSGIEQPAQVLPVSLSAQGELQGKVALRLDYIAAPQPGTVTLPRCYDAIAGHLVIGRVVCGSNTVLAADVTANQMDQICYNESSSPRVAAKKPISIAGCSGPGTLQIYKFSPEMKVELTP